MTNRVQAAKLIKNDNEEKKIDLLSKIAIN